VRAVFGYIYALVGITFLLTLAPIFLSFFLFKPTRSFFDKWTGYLASFALQIVILFAFLSFILSINVSHISNSFVDLVVPVKKTIESGSFRAPWEYCTLCDFKVVDKDTGIELTAAEQKEFIKKGKMVCKTNPGTPIDALAATTPQANGSTTTKEQSAILRFAGAGFTTLLVLAFVIEALLGSVASLAQVIASGVGGGVSMAPQLGGGVSMSGRPTVGMPGDGLYGDFEAGMTRGFGQSNNSVGGFTGGFKEGAAQMLTGRSGSGQEISGSGVKNRFLDWLVDPSQMDRY
jgi:type IV secretory pathway VirB6-like protein